MTNRSKLIPLFFLLICLSVSVNGQSVTMNVLASSGSETQGNAPSLSWTIGESFVEIVEWDDGIQTLGFQQTYVMDQPPPEGLKSQLYFYPNPVSDILTIHSGKHLEKAHVQIYAITGELAFERMLPTGNRFHLDLSILENGTYHLRIIDTNTQNFTFIKLKQ
jgi:hypothetical protein